MKGGYCIFSARAILFSWNAVFSLTSQTWQSLVFWWTLFLAYKPKRSQTTKTDTRTIEYREGENILRTEGRLKKELHAQHIHPLTRTHTDTTHSNTQTHTHTHSHTHTHTTMETNAWQRFPLSEPVVGQNTALYAAPADRINSTYLVSAFPI